MEPRFITTDLPANGQAERTRGYVRTYGIMSILGIAVLLHFAALHSAHAVVKVFHD